eukprot:sb/3479249/
MPSTRAPTATQCCSKNRHPSCNQCQEGGEKRDCEEEGGRTTVKTAGRSGIKIPNFREIPEYAIFSSVLKTSCALFCSSEEGSNKATFFVSLSDY